MGLNRVLAHKKLLRDLAVAQALGYQFKDLKLTASDREVLSFSLVRSVLPAATGNSLTTIVCRLPVPLRPSQMPKTAKVAAIRPTVDCDRIFDYQKPILRPLERGHENPTARGRNTH
jgi:hypothetical protein